MHPASLFVPPRFKPHSLYKSRNMAEPALKRRKVRKGTQSCWECKRRKTRCTFVSPRESVCDGCRSRQTKCIGQDFHEEKNIHGPDRIDASEKAPLPRAKEGKDGGAQSHPLLDVWPSPRDLEAIQDMTAGAFILLHGLICMPYSDLTSNDVIALSRQDVLQQPPRDAHPVMVARKLLLLGTFLQGVTTELTKRLNTRPHLLVDAASRLVTSNDELVNSLEGIECLMMEAMFHNNAGNLRRAWITHRRAMAIAQMMGLHRGLTTGRAKSIDLETQARISSEHMWWRLVITDRYLSLMLGLPQASPENSFGSPEALASCGPLERMEHLASIAGGRILQRSNTRDVAETLEIDRLLQDAASLMPPQWWLIPHVPDLLGEGEKALAETLRLMSQFTHFHLLAQLHLPYLLHPSNDKKYDCSKITAVNASREILLRFVAFRGSEAPVTAYCRGVDFLAFIASTVLTLAHIDAQRRRRNGTPYVLDFLAHHRQSDRGLLERTLECTETMARGGDDAVAGKMSDVLRELLAVEAGVVEGAPYCASVAPSELNELELSGLDENKTLKIHIPYFGTVKVEKEQPLSLIRTGPHSPEPGLVGSMYHIGRGSANADWQEVPSCFTESGDVGSMIVPGLAAEVADWALQGVDSTLFDNLVWGSTEGDDLGGQGLVAITTEGVCAPH
ncbi:hypothetical protein QBC34DRAFT_392261 [Podospora aff. communis PSN243]|uniref:Zn(2)-C6 fungal-type domain-containing protein n=1 Tax=Podospora aff. communis PSN243 TaxID=3040156 RepID=A0AAV9H1K0_9PEZI|nr:hypothetical protein QBC34DRAFT_392261 [Podospora aff. communis PSN243]